MTSPLLLAHTMRFGIVGDKIFSNTESE